MAALALAAFAQEPLTPQDSLSPDWRRIGTPAVELNLASPATGPVTRVWFSDDGNRLLAWTASGRVFETQDFENWRTAGAAVLPPDDGVMPALAGDLPAPGAQLRLHRRSFRLYALGNHVYRSDDGGRHWANLTRYREDSIIGEGMRDLAVSPADADEVVVANEHGVWRSVDGGRSWSGLNESLPNLPVRKLLATPAGVRGTRVSLEGLGVAEWRPGEKESWRLVNDPSFELQEEARRQAAATLGASITALAASGRNSYAGAADGRIWVSLDEGRSWNLSRPAGGGPVEALYVDPADPTLALAALGAAPGQANAARVLRTINAGIFWDDLTSNLPAGGVHGIAADRATGAVYAATDQGVFLTFGDLFAPGPATEWIRMRNLPEGAAMDVRLDADGNQVFAAIEGYGIYATPAPHRFRDARVVNAADFGTRPAAPGSLLSVLGARLVRAQAGMIDAPVLDASEAESQIQVPFEVSGPSTELSLQSASRSLVVELPLRNVSPAIFVDRDGTPLILDGDSGMLLDALHTARSNSRVQILATGLGRVEPDWPTGVAAPLNSPPQVLAPVRAYLDQQPVEVTRATLAPGYVGFYLVEVQMPAVVNAGAAEFYLEADGQQSNRVRIYVEP